MGGFQLWVNLPSGRKMDAPRYQDVAAATIPEVRREDGTTVRVVAGSVDGVEGPVREIVAEPEYLDVSLPAHGVFKQPVPRGHSVFAYVFEGEGRFGVTVDVGYRAEGAGVLAEAPRLLLFADGDEVRVETDEQPARFLLVSGKPLGEPIARYGPFVMTTRTEIEQALRDLRADEFVWRDDAAWLSSRRAAAG
jgi:redox-sensitive bicupin YhaK (pirin superfamily)